LIAFSLAWYFCCASRWRRTLQHNSNIAIYIHALPRVFEPLAHVLLAPPSNTHCTVKGEAASPPKICTAVSKARRPLPSKTCTAVSKARRPLPPKICTAVSMASSPTLKPVLQC
jgi:hypothetical protein